jgi:isopentenyl phosphate kinase
MMDTHLIFLKLGGSLITNKSRPQSPRRALLRQIAEEIARTIADKPALRLVIGHGSGSYGHISAREFGTRSGVQTHDQWHGFARVWHDARTLNQIVIQALSDAGLPVIAFPPSASLICTDGQIDRWDIAPLQSALTHGLIPVVQGDVAFDSVRGGTIVSTEEVFYHLALHLKPHRILLAGSEPGVWADFPSCTRIVPEITPTTLGKHSANLMGSAAVDVTGGMADKVRAMLQLCQRIPHLQVLIFSAKTPGSITSAFEKNASGTLIIAE